MAPGWVPTLSDLEESETSAGCCLGGAGADSGHVPSQSAVGAPRVHGELTKLGISISQAAVSKYMIRHRKPPSQTWRSFFDNHVKDLVSVDFFTLPTATFRVLFVFIVTLLRSATDRSLQCHRPPFCRVDRAADRRCLCMGECSSLHAARPRWSLWTVVQPARRRTRRRRGSDGAALAMAKSVRRKGDG